MSVSQTESVSHVLWIFRREGPYATSLESSRTFTWVVITGLVPVIPVA
ncbi:hypothetical protein J4G37_01610 [Microvirga sp. 3-52]|nr:hypothetical protein [Microvirga sp. 3-52]